jgi:hypothetical protein
MSRSDRTQPGDITTADSSAARRTHTIVVDGQFITQELPDGEQREHTSNATFDEALAVYETIGTCSICGGPVLSGMTRRTRQHRPDHCGDCGAVPKGKHGPVIAMEMPPGARPAPGEWR